MKPALNRYIAGILFALLAGIASLGQAAMTIPAGPLYVGAAVPPIVMLNVTKDQNLYQKAYNDYSDLDGDGYIDTTYKHTIDYYGYFDSYKCYTYSSTDLRFVPVAASYTGTKPAACSGNWHGNFLNWASMSRMDAVRKLLYGGLRSTDGTGAAGITVLQRVYLPTDAHSWAKYYNPVIAQAMDLKPLGTSETWAQRYPAINALTPFNPDATPAAVTSGSSVSIGTGNKVFAVSSTTAFSYGDQVLIEDAADPNNYMVGAVGCVNGTGITMYDGIAAGTSSCAGGSIEVAVEKAAGPGLGSSKTSWKIFNWTQTGLTMCNATLGATTDPQRKSQTNTNPPLLRVAKGNFSLWNANERWQCYWREEVTSPAEATNAIGVTRTNGNRAALSGSYASSLGPNKTTVSSGRIANGANAANSDYIVRVKACDSTALGDEKCASYPSGNYKPIGLLQYYGEKGLLKFGLMTGSYSKNKSGGVLRKNAGSLSDEINTATDGTFVLPAGGNIINNLNKMRMYGYSYGDGTYAVDGTSGSTFCAWGETSLTEGTCLTWGNPMAEMYAESLRYLAGKAVTATFNANDSALISGLTTAAWVDPLSNTNYCAPLNVLNFNASASSYDKDQMTVAADVGSNAVTDTNTVGSEEGITHGYVGNSGTLNNDICSDKAFASLGSIYGICPEGAGIEGSYLMSGVAYHAHINRIRPSTDFPDMLSTDLKSLKVSTYGISLATNVPKITVPVGTGSVTIMPAGRLDVTNVGKGYGGGALVDFKIICQIPIGASSTTITTITKESGGMCGAAGSGAFYVNWEDSEQGGDYDQDMWGRIKYQVNIDNTITITTDVVAESTNMDFGFGYAVSGTTKDGPHFHSGIEGFSYTDPTPVTVTGDLTHINASGGCSSCAPGDGATSVTYTPSGTTAGVMQDPLSYAAKYGGFKEEKLTTNNKPDLVDEWDSKKADGTDGHDGIPDNFFQVTNPNALETALDKAFRAMLNESSASSVATNSTSLQTGSRIYQARFNSNFWSGQLRALDLDPITGDVIEPEAWDAGSVINGQTGSRNIITTGLDTRDGIPFTWAAISVQADTTQMDWLNKNELGVTDSLGSLRVDYLRGSAANEGKSAGKFRERTESKLGDTVNSSPVYVGVPEAGWGGATYKQFRVDNLSRNPMIYAGANDGMLHGFDAATGEEKIAYVPSVVYSNLSKLTGQSYAHQYFVDGTPMVNDIELNSGVWKTVLVGGLNWGGRAIYALDITDPSTFSEGNAGTIVMWEFTSSNDGDLGYTHVQPTYPPFKGISQQIVMMYNGKWALIVNNGYNSDNGKAALFIFFLDHTGGTWPLGSDYIKLVADNAGPDNGLSTPMPYDINDDGVVDFVYAGDLKGNLWKFDVTSTNQNAWNVAFGGSTPLYVAKDSGNNRQPITTAPQMKQHTLGGAMVLFGTGKYLENADTTTYSTQSFYGVWDKDGTTTVTGRSQLKEQLIKETQTFTQTAGAMLTHSYRVTTKAFNPAVDWATYYGWYMDFPAQAVATDPGERIAYNPLLRNDRIVFPTLIPSNTPCLAGGSSWLMELDALTGNRLGVSPFDKTGEGTFDSADLLTGTTEGTVAAGGIKPAEGGIITTPTVVRNKDGGKDKDKPCEYKYASSSTGAVIKTPESCEPPGRIAWREIIQ
ncbi:MAG: PilC/PilY family type IV pilus protein [Sulfuricella sp.]